MYNLIIPLAQGIFKAYASVRLDCWIQPLFSSLKSDFSKGETKN